MTIDVARSNTSTLSTALHPPTRTPSFKLGESCSGWCESHPADWPSKCSAFKACGACYYCFPDGTIPKPPPSPPLPCEAWCRTHPAVWPLKCTAAFPNCRGCVPCVATPPSPHYIDPDAAAGRPHWLHRSATRSSLDHLPLPDDLVLQWSDEFNQCPNGVPDPAVWVHERGYVRNNEMQYYRPGNTRCRNGKLVITAQSHEPHGIRNPDGPRAENSARYRAATLSHSMLYGAPTLRPSTPYLRRPCYPSRCPDGLLDVCAQCSGR